MGAGAKSQARLDDQSVRFSLAPYFSSRININGCEGWQALGGGELKRMEITFKLVFPSKVRNMMELDLFKDGEI